MYKCFCLCMSLDIAQNISSYSGQRYKNKMDSNKFQISPPDPNGAVDTSAAPTITPEEYREIILMRQQVLEIKAQKSDLQDYLSAVQARLSEANEKITSITESLQSKVSDIAKQHGITGEFSISETEPHTINIITNQD